jgi:hypothetical protein
MSFPIHQSLITPIRCYIVSVTEKAARNKLKKKRERERGNMEYRNIEDGDGLCFCFLGLV